MLALADLDVAAYLVERRAGNAYVFVDINPAAAALWSGRDGADLGEMRLEDAFPPEVASRIAESFAACLDRHMPIERDSTVPVPWGEVTARTCLYPLKTSKGAAPQLLGIVTDVTKERRLHTELEQTNARLHVAMEALGANHWFFDAARRTFEISPGFASLLGARYRPVMALDEWLACLHPDDRDDVCFTELLQGKRQEGLSEFRLRDPSGEEHWMRCHRRALSTGSLVTGIAGVVIDVTIDKRLTLALQEQAYTDPLTGLANRRRLEEVLTAEVANDTAPLSLLMVDVDEFKGYNDLYGHPAGDDVLRYIGSELRALVTPFNGTAVRYGGEEFVAVLPGLSAVGAECVATALLERIAALRHCHAASALGTLSVSVGVVTRPAHPMSDDDLIAIADAALYRAKHDGRNCFRMTVLTGADRREAAEHRVSAA